MAGEGGGHFAAPEGPHQLGLSLSSLLSCSGGALWIPAGFDPAAGDMDPQVSSSSSCSVGSTWPKAVTGAMALGCVCARARQLSVPLCKGSKCQARAEGAEFGRCPPAHLCSPVHTQVGFRHPKDYVSYVWARSDDGERFIEKQLCAQVSVSRSQGQLCKMLGVCALRQGTSPHISGFPYCIEGPFAPLCGHQGSQLGLEAVGDTLVPSPGAHQLSLAFRCCSQRRRCPRGKASTSSGTTATPPAASQV